MKNLNPLLAEMKRDERAARGKAMAEMAKNWRRKKRNASAVHQPNIYQMFTSGKPTGEMKTMLHEEAVTINQELKRRFREKVIEAIDNGGKHDGTLSDWRIYKHHTEMAQENKELSAEAKKSIRKARRALNDALISDHAFNRAKKYARKRRKEAQE